MKTQMLIALITKLIEHMPPEMVRNFADSILDWCEDYVKKSGNKVDDVVVGGLCSVIRTAFGIPDND